MQKIEKFSFGTGDRFSHQARAQLSALIAAEKEGVRVVPVWNKSYREHSIIGSNPRTTREQADLSVKGDGWNHSYYVDADHIGLGNVDFFMDYADFFTLDVADFIGKKAKASLTAKFLEDNKKYIGKLRIPGIAESFEVSGQFLKNFADTYINATAEAGKIYRHIISKKDAEKVIIEVSMDETEEPQTPLEMFFILSALSIEGIPLQTIAPKFSGRFNKGVDYVGDVTKFKVEFEQDLAVIKYAITEFGLMENLKLSVHSGSDKFSIYPVINEALKKYDAGLHLKTAGTTWLEELIGLAESGGSGLEIAKKVYAKSLDKYEELAAPYATVIDIDRTKLPTADEVSEWSSEQYVNALRHDQSNPEYNLNVRQLLHVGYKIAADMGAEFTDALNEHEVMIRKNVMENMLERHIKPIFYDL